jgi:enamine deaminase RidA (YjgF/YER057c/UK114 family)
MLPIRIVALATAAALVAAPILAKKKKKEEEITQTLEVLPDPPTTLKVETARMTFEVSPLTNKGLLSQQVKDAIRALWRVNKGETIVKLRAFVAGTGDMRRFPQLVSEMFTEKKLPLPVVTTVQVGALPMEGAAVVIESISVGKKAVNPHGLAFISGQAATAPISPDQARMPVLPLATKSVDNLKTALASVGLGPADTLRVTCFSSSFDDFAPVRDLVTREFAGSAINIVQIQRAPANSVVECEAVARMNKAAEAPVKLVSPQGLEASPNYSHIALVGAPRVVLTGAQMGFRTQDSDVRLAFDRLRAQLDQQGASIRRVAMSSIYPLNQGIMDKVRAIRFDFYDRANPPASTMLPFEGLPSLDATFAIDLVAVAPN